MKKLALVLALVLVMVMALTACGNKCHSCGEEAEELEKIGDNKYCASCILKGDIDAEDVEKAAKELLENLM